MTEPSFIIVGNVWQLLGRDAFCLPHPWPAAKRHILNKVNNIPGWRCVLNYTLHYFFCLYGTALFRYATDALSQYLYTFWIHLLLMCCYHPFSLTTHTHPLPPSSPPTPKFRHIPQLHSGQWLLPSVSPVRLSF